MCGLGATAAPARDVERGGAAGGCVGEGRRTGGGVDDDDDDGRRRQRRQCRMSEGGRARNKLRGVVTGAWWSFVLAKRAAKRTADAYITS